MAICQVGDNNNNARDAGIIPHASDSVLQHHFFQNFNNK